MNDYHHKQSDLTLVLRNPIARAVRHALHSQGKHLTTCSVLTGALLLAAGTASAQEGVLEEVTVTAQKREQSLQAVPISVQVLSAQELEDLNISNFADYVQYMPSVSFQTFGPGQTQIYMRGVADGGDGNFSGTTPSVALYLDEQPVTAIGRNLDVHAYDIARIETMPGPQGTLYGANAQAGTLRIITNQPDPERFESGFDLGINTVSGGDIGYSAEGFVNIPISERAALRLVGWYVEDGGWIDVVQGSQTFSRSGITINNFGNTDPNKNTVESDYNSLTNAGARAALGIDLNENWTATASIIAQSAEADGVFADQPDPGGPGEGKVLRFFQDDYQDEWTQFGLTVKGDLSFAELTFAGSYLDREVDYNIDYTAYAEYSNYVEYYYTCVNYDFSNCNDPRIQYENDSEFERSTVEVRLQSKGDGRLGWIAGFFYNDDEHTYFNQWVIPTIPEGNDIPLDRNVRGREDLYFATNQIRNSSETAFFGELTWSFTDKLSGTLGARWFETEDELQGFVGSRFSCFDPADGNRIGNGTATSPNCGGGLTTEIDDTTYKVNLNYQFTDDFMAYITYSEGYRPGGINREGSDVIPQVYQPDFINNYEIGWKAMLADGTVRFNGAIYMMDWDDLQLTRFDIENFGSFLGLSANTSGATVNGIEGQLNWLISDAWTLTFAASYNKAELDGDYFVGTTDPEPAAPDGTDLPFTPDLKYTLSTRYAFTMGERESYWQLAWNWTDDSWNDLFVADRVKQDSYGILNAAIGTQIWGGNLELYGSNLTDEYAELTRYTRAGDTRIITNRPLTIGLRYLQRF
jgi:outer membrane receptor protein involved in Fe transport